MSATPPVDPWTIGPGEAHRDPRTYLRILWRWKFLFLLFAVAVPALVIPTRSEPPVVYRASTLLQVQSVTVDTSLFDQTSGFTSSQSIEASARLIRTTAVAEAAAKFLKPRPTNPRSLLGAIAVEPDPEAGFITITAAASRGQLAADIANAFASAVVATRTERAVSELNRAIGRIKEQVDTLGPEDEVGRQQLSEQLQRLRALRAAQGSNAQVIEPAVAPSSPLPHSNRRTTILSIIVGLLLALGAVVLAENADRRIRTPAELEELTGLPLLSAIASTTFEVRGPAPPGVAEGFQMLRAALTYFNVERRVKSIVITSAGQQDGKTTVATQLAISVAVAGKRVLLVDADLRRPDVCARLGVEPTPGLGAVLTGEATLNEVLISYPIEDPGGAGRLLILPAGVPPPNPSELLSSEKMRDLLMRLENEADLVIVDTAAALAVSDALPLLQAASGVVVVARMDRSTRDAVRRLQRVIVNADGVPLGVVATGASSGSGYSGYAYEVYADRDGAGSARSIVPPFIRRGRRGVQPPVSRS